MVKVMHVRSLRSDIASTTANCSLAASFGLEYSLNRGITYQKKVWFGPSEGLPILNMTTFEVRLENCKIVAQKVSPGAP
jgi:hypothetical protein